MYIHSLKKLFNVHQAAAVLVKFKTASQSLIF